jgi:hypothetical protein
MRSSPKEVLVFAVGEETVKVGMRMGVFGGVFDQFVPH